MIDLRLGDWRDVMPDVEADSTITDPPFSERTHVGASDEAFTDAPDNAVREAVTYSFWTPADVAAFVAHWSPRTRFWMACMTSHDLIPAFEDAYNDAGRYVFAPVPCICVNPPPRMLGDGPTSGTVYLMVARPKRRDACNSGSLPGHYTYIKPMKNGGGGRGKPDDLMQAIVRDYSAKGHLVADQHAGLGSTLRACRVLGRRSIGAEVDAPTYEKARAALALPFAPDLLVHAAVHGPQPVAPVAKQPSLEF